MKEIQVYFNQAEYSNELDLITKVLRIYSITRLNTKLVKKEEEVLVFYIKYGYSKDTKDLIKEELDMKSTHLNQLNYNLQKKGFLVTDGYNRQKKHLSNSLEQIRKSFLEDKLDTFVIKFKYNG